MFVIHRIDVHLVRDALLLLYGRGDVADVDLVILKVGLKVGQHCELLVERLLLDRSSCIGTSATSR